MPGASRLRVRHRRRRAGGHGLGLAGVVVSPGFSFAGFALRSASITSSACWNFSFDWFSDTRSCGRFGPARLGSTVVRSSSTDVV